MSLGSRDVFLVTLVGHESQLREREDTSEVMDQTLCLEEHRTLTEVLLRTSR
jgi:hypothetical protein